MDPSYPTPTVRPLVEKIENAPLVVVAGTINNPIFNSPEKTETLISHQPSAVWQADKASRFHFSAQATKLVGRNQELKELQAFCCSEANFSWWGILGKGGSGKSRLALELAHALNSNPKHLAWDWMFLGAGQDLTKNLACLEEGWVPSKPTLLIVDYVATVAKAFGLALNACAKNANQWQFPVRILMIERTIQGGWYEQLFSTLCREDLCRIQDTQYRKNHLDLNTFGLKNALMLIEEVLKHRYLKASGPHPLKDKLEGTLRRLDAEHRPLYALFLADALAHGQNNAIGWNAQALMDHVLRHEKKRWKLLGVTEQDIKLLRFTTLAGAINLNQPDDLSNYAKNLLGTTGFLNDDHAFNQRWQTILHGDSIQDHIPKLEPDLLGELFVLND